MMKRLLLALLLLALPAAAMAEAQEYRLTVNFLFEDGSAAAEVQQLTLAAGAEYSVRPPEIDGYTPDPKLVTGVMPGQDVAIDVIYREAAETPAPELPAGTAVPDSTELPLETPAPDATQPPIDAPDATETPEGLTLTIHYVQADGTAVAPDHVQQGLKEGDAYDVESPQAGGLTADLQRVSGVMGAESVEITVTYTEGGFSGGFPSGGFPGGSRPSGMGDMSGMPGMEGETQGPSVTPGEALSDIHTAGDGSMALYGSILLTEDAAAPLATAEGEPLAISLQAEDGPAAFTAQVQDDAIILTGAAGVWHIGGDALRALAQSGYAQLALVCGETMAQLSTEGFACGYVWDQLMMQGMPSSAFVYEIDPARQELSLTVGDAVYAAADIGATVKYVHD